MQALITGCAGFIGSHLTERLLGDGWSVVGLDCFSPAYGTARRRAVIDRISSEERFEFIEGDINEVDLRSLVTGQDVVFHLAARPGVRASWVDFANASRANILATQRVLDAISSHSSTRLVFASSSSVYGRAARYPTTEGDPLAPISPYGVTKAACEALIGAYVSQLDIDVASLRYFTVYGPRQRSDMAFTKWIRAAMTSTPVHVYGDGSAVRDFTYIEDVVDATVAMASIPLTGHEVFNVAGGNPASIMEVLEIIERLVGRDLLIEHVPKAPGDPDRTGGATDHLTEATGWRPRWGLGSGLEAQVRWVAGSDQP